MPVSVRLIFIFAAYLALAPLCHAKTTFHIDDGSSHYSAKLSATCEKDKCSGPGTIKLFSKKTGKLFQAFHSDDLFFYLNTGKPTVNVVQLYNEQSVLIFDDFNFDGYEDIAIRNGNESGYGGPSYDVYVYNRTEKYFIPSPELTALAHENLGMFHVDRERKRLVTFSKSGCCWHLVTEYEVAPRKGLKKVLEIESDSRDPTLGENRINITTRILTNGRWIEKTKIERLNKEEGK